LPTAPFKFEDSLGTTTMAVQIPQQSKHNVKPSHGDREDPGICFACTPAQHNSGRGLHGQNRTLWASWYLTCPLPGGDSFKIYFGGDTGYQSVPNGPVCPIFKGQCVLLPHNAVLTYQKLRTGMVHQILPCSL
jgi:L-ascorbate metabolism protein UlaG (beta-lactamase superfamily)